ncbi:MAG: phospho-N-acetylmuramoyl-pentapeptide-transferase [Synechococcales bacterium]|nr:phospho-N-acetylmuramoyl-pentapeptide-transferase [Synechococcales bacterium]
MDSRLFPSKTLNLSGSTLFWSLSSALALAALLLDQARHPNSPVSLGITLPLLTCAIAVTLLGHWAVPALQALKTGQFIREDGPQSHLTKAGTPTMGGLFFVPVAVLAALLWSRLAGEVVAACALTVAYAGIGWLDDWQVLRRRSNKGITPKAKLALQILFSGLFCLYLWFTASDGFTTVALPLGLALPLGGFFWLLACFVPVAQSNATNLTDGLDGLAGGTAAIAFLGLAALVAPVSPGLMIFAACLSGSCLGFVAHNRHPARVFMGDTGSLALGGAMAAIALLGGQLFGLLVLSGIFLVETLSVMAQVSYYKATKDENGVGKRLFKMSPLHHHLELSGWSERQVVGVFYLIGAGLAIATVLFLYP